MTVRSASLRLTRSVSREFSPPGWRTLKAVLVVGSGFAIYLAERTGSQFFADDFLYLQLARNAHVSWSWFLQDNYGHFAPLTRLAYLAIQRGLGLNYQIAAIIPAILAAPIVAAILAIATRMAGRNAGALLCGLFVAQSLLLLRVSLWWGASIHVMGAAAGYLVCIAAFVAFCETDSEWYHYGSAAALSLALLIQERPLVIVGYLVLIRYLLSCGATKEPIGRQWLARQLNLWIPYAAVVSVYLSYRLFVFSSSPTPTHLENAVSFLGNGLQRSFMPAVVGARTNRYEQLLNLPAQLGWVLLLGAVLWLAIVRRSAYRVVLFIIATYLANVFIMAIGRAITNAPEQARDLQYFLDPYLALPIAFVIGFGCLPKRESLRWPKSVVPLTLAGLAVVAGVFAANLASWSGMIRANDQTAAHSYVNRAQQRLRGLAGPFDFLRLKVSADVVPGFIAPYNDQPAIFSLDPTIARKFGAGSSTKVGLTSTGELVPLHPVTLGTVSLSSQSTFTGQGATTNRDGDVCLSGPPGAYMQIEIPGAQTSSDIFYGLQYSSVSPQTSRVAGVNEQGATYNWSPTLVRKGIDQAVFDRLEGQKVSELQIILENTGTNFCIHKIWVGNVGRSEDAAGCSVLDHYGAELRRTTDCSEAWPFGPSG